MPDFAPGRWYPVAADHVIGQAGVGGPYVNGDDGRVVVVDDGRVARFDAFAGDRLVDGRWTAGGRPGGENPALVKPAAGPIMGMRR